MVSVKILRGVSSGVTVGSDCLGGYHESWLSCLWATKLERNSLVLLYCSGWESIESKLGWWSNFQWGVWSPKLQQKWLSVWKFKRCIGDHTNTHSYDLMMKRPNHPDTHVQHDWPTVQARSMTLVIDCSWSRWRLCDCECDFVCECDICFHGEHNRHIWSKELGITRTRSQAWPGHQHAETWMQWTRKANVKTHTSSRSEIEYLKSSSETLQGTGSEIGAGQNFGGGCSHYNRCYNRWISNLVSLMWILQDWNIAKYLVMLYEYLSS